jgi:hypothetical protein
MASSFLTMQRQTGLALRRSDQGCRCRLKPRLRDEEESNRNRDKHHQNPIQKQQLAYFCMDRLKEGACAWKAEPQCANQSSPTARPAHRILSREWLGLLNPNLMHKYAEVAIKNWALRWTDAGHHRRQNRWMTAQIRSNALLAWQISGARAEDRLANGTWRRDRDLS